MANATVVAAVLAAGAGSRFDGDGHKLLAPLDGVPVVVRAVGAAVSSGLPTIVVAGAVDLSDVLASEPVEIVANPRWAEGQATSLVCAVAVARGRGAEVLVVGLGDQPFVEPEAWRAVADASPASPILVATYEGRRRNPVGLHRSVWDELPTEGDEGARQLMRGRPELVSEVPCPGRPVDIDTLEDLRRWS
jgi:CTP:molybdopterin cytidylyltransferase MocA